MVPDEAPGLKEDPAKIQAVVEEVQQTSKQVKKEIRLDQSLIISEVQLLLADKRTAYALMRTGVTVSLIPMSIWTVLVATSKLWDPFSALWLLLPLIVVGLCLFSLGVYLIFHALRHIAHIERTMGALRQSATFLEQLLYRHRGWHF
jgi:hypothetical protein